MTTQTQTTISGTVTQVIPPEKHDKYALGDDLRDYAEGRYVATIEDPDARPESRWERFKRSMSSWIDDPGSTTEWIYHVVVDEAVREGDAVIVDVERVPDVSDTWDGTITHRG